ncbi:DEAD/DEAH box helicase [Sorangium sp. KYC3313]|uniref:C-terminal helicase domain-containing protein n=1 Tax=Sorangium sp. KYC3313 TaxID=3449740 RepID=UPI003F8BD0DA
MSTTKRKAFQQATVDHALARLRDRKGSRRFLVADEVGLGKTLIAQGVIEDLCADASAEGRVLRVFYVCSSLGIASQNTTRLLDVLPTEEQREAAGVPVGRLTEIPGLEAPPDAPFHLYSLTPGTSFQAGTGRLAERVLIGKALEQIWPDLPECDGFVDAMRGQAGLGSWRHAWNKMQWPERGVGYLSRFRAHLAQALNRSPHAWRGTIQKLLRARFEETVQHRDTIELLRRAMTLAVVEQLAPDLVIFDEFQRFFEVLPIDADDETDEQDEDDDRIEEAHHVVRTMLRHEADPAVRPAVLLLSATPYRMYARFRDGGRHHEELFDLLRFLHGDSAAKELPQLQEDFQLYRERIIRDPPGSEAVHAVRQRIEQKLKRVMARTERRALMRAELSRERSAPRTAPVEARDLAVFRHFAACVRPEDHHMVEPLWSSIPYPIQMMRHDYVASRHADLTQATAPSPEVRLSRKRLCDYSHAEHPNPKLRALLDAMPQQVLALPWMPPSRPWWPLGGIFRDVAAGAANPSKALIFSRFRAVPRALATLLSYEAERAAFQPEGGRRFGYWMRHRSDARKARKGRARAKGRQELLRPPPPAFTFGASRGHDLRLLLMFLPLPRLAELGDPLTFEAAHEMVLATARERVRARLEEILDVDDARERREPAWKWALHLERTAPTWEALREGIEQAADELRAEHRGVATACAHLLEAPYGKIEGVPSPAELDDLAEHALTAPGMVLWRARTRVFGAAQDPAASIARVARITLVALRTYLDAPEWHRILAAQAARRPAWKRRAATQPYPGALRRAVWDGNLEAVLDEYLVSLQGLGHRSPSGEGDEKALSELGNVLAIRGVRLEVDGLGPKRTKLPLRCHAALPFGLTSSEASADSGERLRSDTVREAFNSPFRPMALVTTSIGQEGLDFHRYCGHVVHWDLPSNPVDLEQREGRVARYGGLSVRQALAARIGELARDRSPWHLLAERFRDRESAGGLVPWWDFDGARIRHTIVRPSFSEQERRLAELEDALALYRYALGQPDQEALVRALERRIAGADDHERERLREWLREAALDLCPLLPEQRRPCDQPDLRDSVEIIRRSAP